MEKYQITQNEFRELLGLLTKIIPIKYNDKEWILSVSKRKPKIVKKSVVANYDFTMVVDTKI